MENIISAALKAAKKKADEHSPSKLFRREVGVNLGLGVALGIDDSTKAVVSSVQNQVKSIEDAYDLESMSKSVDVGINSTAQKSKSSTQSESGASGGVAVYQTNYYSQAHSRYELYKSKQQTAAAVRLALAEV